MKKIAYEINQIIAIKPSKKLEISVFNVNVSKIITRVEQKKDDRKQ